MTDAGGAQSEFPGRCSFRSAPYHPMAQGKIEPWHQTMKNPARKLLLHGDFEAQIGTSSVITIAAAATRA
jgi:hypothetical protein